MCMQVDLFSYVYSSANVRIIVIVKELTTIQTCNVLVKYSNSRCDGYVNRAFSFMRGILMRIPFELQTT